MQYLTDAEDLILHVNVDVADELGIELSDAVLEAANRIYENGQLVEQ